ncbi:MAG: hypothetical protein KTR29_16970, partial [Rhodothermaceae bacterium]|nr:hypothetical protein [Rhodothermaceae bacterium]
YTVSDFGGNASALVADPTNPSNNVMQSEKTAAAQLWAGTTASTANGLASAIPFSMTDTKISVRVWSPDANIPVRVKVEDKTVTPILTESEFQTRKSGVESNVWMRRVRMQGNTFVRAYMESLNTQWNREVMVALQSMLKERLDAMGYNPQRTLTLNQEEIAPLRAALQPDAVLATYSWRGQNKSFTVADYVFWLETLPLNEVYYRAGASMGRALRNEVFALNGEAEGLEKDPTYKENMWHVGTIRLASRVQQEAIEQYTGQPTEEQIADTAERLKLLSVSQRFVDMQHIEFASFEEAKEAQQRVLSGSRRATAYRNYAEHINVVVDSLDRGLQSHIEKAPQNEWVVIGTASSWFLANVSRVQTTRRSIEDVRSEVVQRLSTQLPVVDLVSDLRDQYIVELDTLLFKQKMREEGLLIDE